MSTCQKIRSILVPLLFSMAIQAQPFMQEIRRFERLDSLQAPPHRPILFIGSSSFTNWKDMADYFSGYPILNRGFGGSSLPHLIMYADAIIFKYQPKQLFIYCGENDLAGDASVTADSVLQRFTRLFNLIRKKLPRVPIVYISMKPSPSRKKYLPVMQQANREIKLFLSGQRHTHYLDVYSVMLTPEGSIRSDIFIADSLHMNSKGYSLWQPLIRPLLKN